MSEIPIRKVGRPRKEDRRDRVVSFRCREGDKAKVVELYQRLMYGDPCGEEGLVVKPLAGGEDSVLVELRENNRRLFEDIGRLEGKVAELEVKLKACSEMGVDEKGRRWMEAYFRLRDLRGTGGDGIDQTA